MSERNCQQYHDDVTIMAWLVCGGLKDWSESYCKTNHKAQTETENPTMSKQQIQCVTKTQKQLSKRQTTYPKELQRELSTNEMV